MLILLSPAKKQDFETQHPQLEATKPQASKESAILMGELKQLKKNQIATLMGVSESIAELNHQRFQQFDPAKYNRSNAKQALYAFRGDAYRALDADTLKPKALDYLQQHLIILSGLYGYLRPLDLIQPYRLEMKTPLKNPRGKDLYEFWGDRIANALEKSLSDHKNKTIINLASGEYFKAVERALNPEQVLTLTFKEKKGSSYKVVGINAKRARGAMTRFLADKQINDPQKIKTFDVDGYQFSEPHSSEREWVFIRDAK